MIWAIAGLVYAGVYVALVSALADYPHVRVLIGDVALLLPPIAPLVVIARNRGRSPAGPWNGRLP